MHKTVRGFLSLLYCLSKLAIYKFFSLMLCRKWRWFDDGVYRGKRVIIVGPASSSLNYLPGSEVDKFDIIVRVNKSPQIISGNEDYIGSRTDVLYHCCNEDPVTGGGRLDADLLTMQRTRSVVYTYAERAVAYNFYKVLLSYPDIVFVRTHAELYKSLKKKYRSRMPTTGLQALNHIMHCDFKELHITGFTFFKTSYADGYRDQYKTAEEAAGLASSRGNHDPDDELRLFKEVYNSFRASKSVVLDSELIALIAMED